MKNFIRIDDVLFSALSMGSKVVRSHSLGISTGAGEFHYQHMGWNGTLWPQLDADVEDNFASIDYAVYRAGQLGLKLIIPLTDHWNYYHGGIHDFLGWRGKSVLGDVEDNCVCNIDPHEQDIFYTDGDIKQDFFNYVQFILNHVNPLTDLGRILHVS